MQLLEWLQVATTNSYPNKKYILQRSLNQEKKTHTHLRHQE